MVKFHKSSTSYAFNADLFFHVIAESARYRYASDTDSVRYCAMKIYSFSVACGRDDNDTLQKWPEEGIKTGF